MKKKDKKLIQKAILIQKKKNFGFWGEVYSLVEKASSEEAKEIISSIASSMYHSEEWSINNE